MPKKTLNNVNIAPAFHADFVTKSQQFITKSIRHGRFPNDSLRNRKKSSFKPNLNTDLTLIEYSKITFDLINQQKAVQNCDALLNDNTSHNYCITDQAIKQSKKLGEAINSNLHQMALEQAATIASHFPVSCELIRQTLKGLEEELKKENCDDIPYNFFDGIKRLLYSMEQELRSFQSIMNEAGHKEEINASLEYMGG